MLTSRERLIRAIKGQEVDHVPFSPFLAYYFDTLPKDVRERGQVAYLEDMGADVLLRGVVGGSRTENDKCTKTEKVIDNKRYITIGTPKGNLYLEYTYVKDANTWFLTKHPVSTVEELYILKCYYEDLKILSNAGEINSLVSDIHDRGLVVPAIGSEYKTCFQSLVEHWIGTIDIAYMAEDNPDELEEVLEVMKKKSYKAVEFASESNAKVCISWEDSSTTNVSPNMYKKYIAPEITSWNKLLAERDIVYIQHACGLLKDLLKPMSEQGIRGIESITPFPTGDITIDGAVSVLPKEISIIGGIDPMMMLNSSIDEIDVYAKHLIDITRDRGFILANSDSCPPNVAYEKFLYLANLVKTYR